MYAWNQTDANKTIRVRVNESRGTKAECHSRFDKYARNATCQKFLLSRPNATSADIIINNNTKCKKPEKKKKQKINSEIVKII